MKYTLIVLLGALLISKRGQAIIPVDKAIFYQNCEIFNNAELYNGPICGSNGVTYSNGLYLDCVNYQTFKNVAFVHSGPCLPVDDYCKPNLFYRPVCGSDGETYTNVESLLCDNYNRSRNVTIVSEGTCDDFDYCYRHGTTHYGINLVCGNNGFTYQNAAQVKCLQRRNHELKIIHDGGCTVRDVYAIYGTTLKVCEIAKERYEWNPVCASDGVTYANPFEFLCYEADLKQLVSDDECGTSTHNSCVLLTSSGITNRTFTSKDEVCGNDGVTYQSIHHLQCYSSQNKYLFQRHSGPCSGPDDNPCGSIPEEELRLPVCGSDNTSYVSPEALWCAKFRFPEKALTFVHDGPC
ncbi:Serine protease inhibitor dipetalogastin (Fragment) [Anthophora plagiata]